MYPPVPVLVLPDMCVVYRVSCVSCPEIVVMTWGYGLMCHDKQYMTIVSGIPCREWSVVTRMS